MCEVFTHHIVRRMRWAYLESGKAEPMILKIRPHHYEELKMSLNLKEGDELLSLYGVEIQIEDIKNG